eukprot:TRINITY_DN8779_c0_g2_i1.p1 TRINITY_DN8779_c0_g2~~TRINITY_DN8779_c0_g2_i1.p1  ORF type:complete len:778 (+),score=162.11 TRINITY_DN8779_c0_g2_i1:49-2334(+)
MYVASIELVVDLMRYLNIDLFSQGLYCISVGVKGERGEVARPYEQYVKEKDGIVRKDMRTEGTVTRSFFVKYKEQLEVLHDVTKFSLVVDGMKSMKQFGDTLLISFNLHHITKEALEKRKGQEVFARVRGSGPDSRSEPYPPKILKKINAAIDSENKILRVTLNGKPVTLDISKMEEISEDGYVRKIVKTSPDIPIDEFTIVSTVVIPYKLGLIPHTEWVPVVFTNWFFSKIDVHISGTITGISWVPESTAAYGIPPSTEGCDLSQEQKFRVLCSYLCYAYYLLYTWGKNHRALYQDQSGRLFNIRKDKSEVEVDMEDVDINEFPGSEKNLETVSSQSSAAIDLAWEKVEKGRKISAVHVCHFMTTESNCLADVDDAVKDAKYAVDLLVDSVAPLEEVLQTLSKEVVGAWLHLHEPEGALYHIKEVYSRTAFFKMIKEHYRTLLNPVKAPAVPPIAPNYFDYPNYTRVEIHEVTDDANPLSFTKKENIPKTRTEPASGCHLMVLVHGWKGCPTDLSGLKNYLQLYIPPGMEFHCVTAMGPTPNSSIKKLGEKVAREIVEYIDTMQLNVGRLSFVGHSMGTIVIRAALLSSHMAPYLGFLWTYVSLSGPHLGIASHDDKRIGCAVGLLSSVKRTTNIRELRLDTAFMHNLSMNDKLGMFKHVLLFGSDHDTFVSPLSALAQPHQSHPKSSRKQCMVDDIARNLSASYSRCVSYRKFRVKFIPHNRKELTSFLDRVVGKSVHIAFLVDIDFINAVINNFLPYF